MDFPTFNDLFRVGRDEALSRQGKLTVEAVERDGSDANIMVASSAAIGDEVVTQLVKVAGDLFLDSARGPALKRLVFDRYGLIGKPAAAALGSVQFSTVANNPTAFSIPKDTLLQTSDGIQFITTEAQTFAAGTTGPVLVGVRSVLAGADQQAAAGTITNVVSTIPGSPSDLAVTNTVATAGATDEEDEDSLRGRARGFFLTARRGTKTALVQGALAVPGVTSATCFEVVDALGRPARFVFLVITDVFTEQLANLSTVPATYQAQSQQLAVQVFNALDDVRAAGIYVQVMVAQVVLQSVLLNLSFQAGVNVDLVAQEARAAVVSSINGLAPGIALEPANLNAALAAVSGLVITGNELLSPAGAVVPKPLQALRTTLALVTATTSGGTVLATSANPDAYLAI